jgi:hypothetical protein
VRRSLLGRRFAVADGTSEGGYSRVWARILADEFCREEPCGFDANGLDGWLHACRDEWRRSAEQIARRDLPWFARATLNAGAFATFLGLGFADAADGAWTAVARGDACIFVVRDDALGLAFPVQESGRFDNHPALVASSDPLRGSALQTAAGAAQPGDAFYLATDALAQWFLDRHERGEKPWSALSRVRTQRQLTSFVTAARRSRALHNDDVTLMSIDIVSAG